MRKVVVSTFMTLDGRVSELREWSRPFDDEAQVRYHDELLAHSEGLLLGRKTYEAFAVIWPPRQGAVDYADKINGLPKYVASDTLEDLKWDNSHLIGPDLAAGVATLKEQGNGDLVVYGGPDFVQTLLAASLVDEYRVLISPVLLGKGRHILNDGAERADLQLVDSTVIDPGVVVLSYRVTS